jgi:hypothetical protein|tara:strand:+ start:28 stop:366 length:339 start_codon:yes stop_codon:yes gene_type:complete
MANNFKVSVVAGVGTSPASAYTCPANSTETTIIGLSLANITTSQITVSAHVSIGAAGNGTARLVKDAPIPAGSSLVVVGGDQKLVLNNADHVMITSSAASSVDVVTSYLEIS